MTSFKYKSETNYKERKLVKSRLWFILPANALDAENVMGNER